MGKNLSRYVTTEDTHVGNRDVKICSTLYVVRESPSKSVVRYHRIPIRMTKIQTLTTPDAGKNVEQHELPFIANGSVK